MTHHKPTVAASIRVDADHAFHVIADDTVLIDYQVSLRFEDEATARRLGELLLDLAYKIGVRDTEAAS